jgi:hypothetical protein
MTSADWDSDSDDFDDGPHDEPDEADLATCPACGAEVYEDAEQCPVCGEWITRSTHPFAGRSMWFVVIGVLGLAATIVALVLAGF